MSGDRFVSQKGNIVRPKARKSVGKCEGSASDAEVLQHRPASMLEPPMFGAQDPYERRRKPSSAKHLVRC